MIKAGYQDKRTKGPEGSGARPATFGYDLDIHCTALFDGLYQALVWFLRVIHFICLLPPLQPLSTLSPH